MPLPDATKDQRIYQLLKNIDLGNLTFSEFQTAAQSVFAEPEAEDTLRRIVLVNTARMAVAGDWNGLTSAGGGGSTVVNYHAVYPQAVIGSFGYNVTTEAISSSTPTMQSTTVTYARPFYAAATGDFNEAHLYVNSAGTGCSVDVAIYSSTDGGSIGDRLCTGTIDLNSTGERTVAMSGTTTATAGTLYFFAYIFTASARATIAGIFSSGISAIAMANGLLPGSFSENAGTLPASWTASSAATVHTPLFGVTYS
jgi:hypothetical protein